MLLLEEARIGAREKSCSHRAPKPIADVVARYRRDDDERDKCPDVEESECGGDASCEEERCAGQKKPKKEARFGEDYRGDAGITDELDKGGQFEMREEGH